jgi:aminoglycoside phosphotransferase (APT) family kinase protein
MARSLGGGEASNVVRLGGGTDCATHVFELGGQRYVLKRARPGTDPVTDEFENLQHAARCGVPTPIPITCDPAGDWFGTPALVMSALPGSHNLHPADEELWLREVARALAAIHDTPIGDFPDRRAPRWERWRPWSDEPDGRLAAITDAVDELRTLAASEPRVFTHDDFHPSNAVFLGDRLTGIVDWAYASVAPRGSAVASCRKDLAIHPGGSAPDRFLAAYEAETGLKVDNLAHWDVLQGAKALQWGHRWPAAFEELNVHVDERQIIDASTFFVDKALHATRDRSHPLT